jgi:putrescine importer
LNQHVGFLAGWAMMLDYFLIPLLSIIYAALTAERLLPGVPYLAWAVLFTLGLTLVNIPGIRVTTRASAVMMIIMTICAALFIIFAARYIASSHGFVGLFDLNGIWRPASFELRPLMLGASIAAISYIGFDAISTLAEDTINPHRDIAVSTILVCILQAIFCVLTVYLAGLAWPNYRTFPQAETIILDIGRMIGGNIMFVLITFVLLVAGLASALTGQAGASRLLYGMGRDGVISNRLFAYINPRFSTPTRSIYFMGAVSLAGALFMRFQMAVELLNFGAFVGFILVNLSVIRYYYFRLRRRRGIDFLTNLIFPAVGTIICTYVWLSLSRNAKFVGFAWLAIGAAYLAVITRGFRVSPGNLGGLAVEAAGMENR